MTPACLPQSTALGTPYRKRAGRGPKASSGTVNCILSKGSCCEPFASLPSMSVTAHVPGESVGHSRRTAGWSTCRKTSATVTEKFRWLQRLR